MICDARNASDNLINAREDKPSDEILVKACTNHYKMWQTNFWADSVWISNS